jgi:(2Fe-2S) ferredoxin
VSSRPAGARRPDAGNPKWNEPRVSYYQRHVFFCCNQRQPGEQCCNNQGSQAMRDYAKDRVKQLRLSGHGKVRINQAGCLDRCNEGPVLVIYPEAVWYTYVDREDIDEIITEHLVKGRIVERLRI